MSNSNREIAWKKYAENRQRIRKAISELSMAYTAKSALCNSESPFMRDMVNSQNYEEFFSNQILSQKEDDD